MRRVKLAGEGKAEQKKQLLRRCWFQRRTNTGQPYTTSVSTVLYFEAPSSIWDLNSAPKLIYPASLPVFWGGMSKDKHTNFGGGINMSQSVTTKYVVNYFNTSAT